MGRSSPRLGSEVPRIFTPPLRELTEESTFGFVFIHFAEVVCGVTLLPWQKWLAVHGLELAPGLTVSTRGDRGPLDPLFRFRRIIVLVARQNGKSRFSQVLALFALYVLDAPLTIGTAQDLDTAEEVWEGAVDIINESPELAALADKPTFGSGKKSIRRLSGERYMVKTANRRAARGRSSDLILLDELREHQSWDAYAAIAKTTQARPAAQIWAFSNAGDATSIVLRYFRKRAHEDLGDPDGINAADDPSLLLPTEGEVHVEDMLDEDDMADSIGLFEWSAEPGCEVTDRDGMAAANPALGHYISMRVLMSDAKSDPEWVYRTEVLCQWSDGSLEGLFPAGAWESQVDESSGIGVGEESFACLTIGWDRVRSYIAIAGKRADGKIHVGVSASRAGTDWVADWLRDADAPKVRTLVVQSRGAPESSLIEELERCHIPLTMWGGPDLSKAHGNFYDQVAAGDGGPLRHRSQPLLDVAVATAAVKPLGEAWVLDLRKSAADAAPLKATIGAVWGMTNASQSVSAYEDDSYEFMML